MPSILSSEERHKLVSVYVCTSASMCMRMTVRMYIVVHLYVCMRVDPVLRGEAQAGKKERQNVFVCTWSCVRVCLYVCTTLSSAHMSMAFVFSVSAYIWVTLLSLYYWCLVPLGQALFEPNPKAGASIHSLTGWKSVAGKYDFLASSDPQVQTYRHTRTYRRTDAQTYACTQKHHRCLVLCTSLIYDVIKAYYLSLRISVLKDECVHTYFSSIRLRTSDRSNDNNC
jgi:hypothetical protein